MGLLTAAQLTAIEGTPLYRRGWRIHVPRAAGSATFDTVVIHDDDGPGSCVENAGSREVEATNQSLAEPGRLTRGLYRIAVSNEGGAFYTSSIGNHFYNTTGTYQADPVECRLQHQVYVLAAGAWDELDMVAYTGLIQGVEYDDNQNSVTIEAVALAAVALEYKWSESDGVLTETGMDVTWP